MVMFRNIYKFSPWTSPLFVRSAYKKALKVIDSCENESHLDATSNYISNFLRLQSEDLGNGHFQSDEYIFNSYRRLKDRFDEKKKSLLNE